jgi:hypothetical protein
LLRTIASVIATAWLVLGTNPVMAQIALPQSVSGIQISYVPPTNPAHQKIYQRLVDRKVLEQYKEFMSPLLLKTHLFVRLQGCDGKPGASYVPSLQSIIYCYEYIEYIEKIAARGDVVPGVKREDIIVGDFVETLLHETSHAIFHLFDIPIFAREEDSADALAAYVLLQLGTDVARRTLTGEAFFMRATALMGRQPGFDDFADEHGTDAQRFFNNLCFAYGGDPDTFADLAQLLPERRRVRCKGEYLQTKRAFDKLIMPHVDQAQMKKVQGMTWLVPADGTEILPPGVGPGPTPGPPRIPGAPGPGGGGPTGPGAPGPGPAGPSGPGNPGPG